MLPRAARSKASPANGAMQIESYRTRLEAFEQTLNSELFRYYSGLKNKLELVPLYSDYSDLFCTESIRDIETALKSEPFESRRRSLEKIWVFLIDQYLDFRTAPLRQEIAQFEAKETVQWEGKEIPFIQVSAHLRRETDALRRRRLHERQVKALGRLEELKEKEVFQLQSAAADLGFQNYIQARERISGIHFETLLTAFEEVLRRLEDKYLERFKVSLEATLGIPWHETGSWDVPHWEERNDRPAVFAERNLRSVVEATIAELGIRPEHADAVSLDLESRQSKQPLPVCVPIRIPQEIKVVMMPGDGSRYYAALLHECGHACHFAWMSPSLAPEHRIVGDRAVTEAYGFLFEHFLQEPDWLARMLSFSKPENFLRYQALHHIALIRRCAGRLRFALTVHGPRSFGEVPRLYSDVMKMYTGLQHTPESWPAGLDDGLASADYLRGWALETMLREYLRTKFGNAWALNGAASGFLKEIWETGFLYSAEELCREIGLGSLEPRVLADQLWEGLQY
jgi:hypothetical protein